MAKHFVCTGECGGVSAKAQSCGDEECSMHGEPLVECDCKDGKHEEALS